MEYIATYNTSYNTLHQWRIHDRPYVSSNLVYISTYNTFWNTQVLLISIWLACQLQQIDRFSGWLLLPVRSSAVEFVTVECSHSSTGIWCLSLIHPIAAQLDYWYTWSRKDTVSRSVYFDTFWAYFKLFVIIFYGRHGKSSRFISINKRRICTKC